MMDFVDVSGLFVSCFGLGFIAGMAFGRVMEIIRSMGY